MLLSDFPENTQPGTDTGGLVTTWSPSSQANVFYTFHSLQGARPDTSQMLHPAVYDTTSTTCGYLPGLLSELSQQRINKHLETKWSVNMAIVQQDE